MVIFTSDNGPWLGMGKNGGHAGELRDGKFSNYEGGVRVPFIVRWPGTWKKGKTSSTIIQTIDLFPTVAHYVGSSLPDVHLDGSNIASIFEDPMLGKQGGVHLYCKGAEPSGIRSGDWKFMPLSGARHVKENMNPELFNLTKDPSEKRNVHDRYPEVVEKLSGELDEATKAF